MTAPDLTEDELLAFRLVERTQRRADVVGRDVRVLLALVLVKMDRPMVEAYVLGEPLVPVATG